MNTFNRETPESPCPSRHSPELLHQHARAHQPQRTEHDLFIVTDGSGYRDGFAGAAAVVFSPRHKFFDLRLAAFSGADTERAEFEALMLGLQSILDHMEWGHGAGLQAVQKSRPLVHWLSDRESLVLAVAINPETSKPYYQRRTPPDLWARFAFYESCFRVTAEFSGRNEDTMQRVVDAQSSTMREMMKGYITDEAANLQWMDGWEAAWEHPEKFHDLVEELRRRGASEDLTKVVAEKTVALGKDFVSAAVSVAQSSNYHRTLNGLYLPHL